MALFLAPEVRGELDEIWKLRQEIVGVAKSSERQSIQRKYLTRAFLYVTFLSVVNQCGKSRGSAYSSVWPTLQEVSARTVEMMLSSCPQLSLSKIASELGIDRHTLERALLRTRRKAFRELRAEILASKAAVLLRQVPPLSVKEVAFMLGYESARSFSRFVKQRLCPFTYFITPWLKVRVGQFSTCFPGPRGVLSNTWLPCF